MRTLLGQAATRVPCLQDRRGKSLLSRISGLRLGPPTSRRRREQHSGRREGGREEAGAGITKPRAWPGGDILIKPILSPRQKRGTCPALSPRWPQRHPFFLLKEQSPSAAGETEARSLNYRRVAEGRDESPLRLPAFLLRMLRSPFRPPGLVSTQDWPAAGPR